MTVTSRGCSFAHEHAASVYLARYFPRKKIKRKVTSLLFSPLSFFLCKHIVVSIGFRARRKKRRSSALVLAFLSSPAPVVLTLCFVWGNFSETNLMKIDGKISGERNNRNFDKEILLRKRHFSFFQLKFFHYAKLFACLFHENIYVYIEIPLLNDRAQVWIQIGLLTHSRRVAPAFLSNLRDKTPSLAGASVMKRATDKSRCQSFWMAFETSKGSDSKEFGRKSFSSFPQPPTESSTTDHAENRLQACDKPSRRSGRISLVDETTEICRVTSHSHSVISLK